MTRHDLIFDLTYSYHLEKMYSVLTGRIDRAITSIIIAVGFSVFTSLYSQAWFGALIAGLSVSQVVYQFGRSSGISGDQAKNYLTLLSEASDLDDSALKQRFISLQSMDATPWGVLSNPAYKRACHVLGLEDRTDKLTLCEKFFAWLAGDLPKESKRMSKKPSEPQTPPSSEKRDDRRHHMAGNERPVPKTQIPPPVATDKK